MLWTDFFFRLTCKSLYFVFCELGELTSLFSELYREYLGNTYIALTLSPPRDAAFLLRALPTIPGLCWVSANLLSHLALNLEKHGPLSQNKVLSQGVLRRFIIVPLLLYESSSWTGVEFCHISQCLVWLCDSFFCSLCGEFSNWFKIFLTHLVIVYNCCIHCRTLFASSLLGICAPVRDINQSIVLFFLLLFPSLK